MFRSRKYSSSKTEPVHTSSLSSGNASIKRPEAPVVVVQEQQPRFYSSDPSHHTYEEYNEDDIIDLQATPSTTPTSNELTIESMSAVIAAAVQMSSAGGAPSSLSLGSASILQPFSKTENAAAANKSDVKRRFSTRLFSWSSSSSKKSSSPASPTSPISTPATPALEPSSPFDSTSNFTMMDDDNSSQGSPRTSSASARKSSCVPDDGRDELMYRGIQIKEIKTTLKTLVISDEVRCPMPEVRLERPGFARINY